jgi:hypothetical protein
MAGTKISDVRGVSTACTKAHPVRLLIMRAFTMRPGSASHPIPFRGTADATLRWQSPGAAEGW